MAEPDAPRPVDPAELGFERIRYEESGRRATITLPAFRESRDG